MIQVDARLPMPERIVTDVLREEALRTKNPTAFGQWLGFVSEATRVTSYGREGPYHMPFAVYTIAESLQRPSIKDATRQGNASYACARDIVDRIWPDDETIKQNDVRSFRLQTADTPIDYGQLGVSEEEVRLMRKTACYVLDTLIVSKECQALNAKDHIPLTIQMAKNTAALVLLLSKRFEQLIPNPDAYNKQLDLDNEMLECLRLITQESNIPTKPIDWEAKYKDETEALRLHAQTMSLGWITATWVRKQFTEYIEAVAKNLSPRERNAIISKINPLALIGLRQPTAAALMKMAEYKMPPQLYQQVTDIRDNALDHVTSEIEMLDGLVKPPGQEPPPIGSSAPTAHAHPRGAQTTTVAGGGGLPYGAREVARPPGDQDPGEHVRWVHDPSGTDTQQTPARNRSSQDADTEVV